MVSDFHKSCLDQRTIVACLTRCRDCWGATPPNCTTLPGTFYLFHRFFVTSALDNWFETCRGVPGVCWRSRLGIIARSLLGPILPRGHGVIRLEQCGMISKLRTWLVWLIEGQLFHEEALVGSGKAQALSQGVSNQALCMEDVGKKVLWIGDSSFMSCASTVARRTPWPRNRWCASRFFVSEGPRRVCMTCI